MISKKIFEAFGWVGIGCIIIAYALSTLGQRDSSSPIFLSLNIFGAVGIIIDSGHQRDWQPVVLNIFWLVIALIGLIQYLLT